MVKRRAVSKADKALQPDTLPMLYKSLVPLTPERHRGLYLSAERRYDYAATVNAIPLTAEEFAPAQRNYPIVFAGEAQPTPVALVGTVKGRNEFVSADGTWAENAYIPAYLRRYPFAYVRESASSTRNILCADLSSTLFGTRGEDDRALFDGEAASPMVTSVMEFCNNYEQATARTRQVMDEATAFDLFEESEATITRNGKTVKVEGFRVISEEKLRKLSDKDLADLARRGVLGLFAAHHLSISNFAAFGAGS